jgi:OPA family glycerol-3-phosphate transporter-like MFS transporter/OPA family sugar phosphate sensor protein UhpC-like MFS transporter
MSVTAPQTEDSGQQLTVPKRFPLLLRIFEPAPPVPVTLTDPAQIAAQHRYWQRRVMVATIVGYATYYFVRKNLSIAMPVMEKTLGVTKTDLGLFLTLHGVLYGVSKFVNGFFGDRCHVRTFMVTGLVLSAIVNVFFGLSSAVVALGIFWMINGWFQGMGFPPCARAFTHWVPPQELATKMSIWNASTNIGAGLVVVMCSYLLTYYGNWRLCFFVPAALALLCSVFLWFALPDTPPSVGLPEVEGTQSKPTAGDSDDWKAVAVKYVFSNPYIWLLAVANFFVYTIRYAMLDWGPTLLTQAKHLQLTNAGWMVAGFEISGMTGALIGGWLTDRLFGGRGFRSCVFYMALAGVSILLFWKVAGQSVWLNTLLLCCSGFFIYGPQCLISIAAANLATKRAAATAVGLTGIFGYASTTLSGVGLGKLVQTYGWNAAFIGMLIVAAIGTLACALGWNAKAHGYGD